MSNIEEEFQEVLEERDGENHDLSQLLDQLEADKAQKSSELQIAVTARDAAFAEQQNLQREICQLQQQLGSRNTALQDQVPWNDIQLVLDQAHAELNFPRPLDSGARSTPSRTDDWHPICQAPE